VHHYDGPCQPRVWSIDAGKIQEGQDQEWPRDPQSLCVLYNAYFEDGWVDVPLGLRPVYQNVVPHILRHLIGTDGALAPPIDVPVLYDAEGGSTVNDPI
jgi:hypothetical protein